MQVAHLALKQEMRLGSDEHSTFAGVLDVARHVGALGSPERVQRRFKTGDAGQTPGGFGERLDKFGFLVAAGL
ncbi:MAG: hypothetical protein JO217_05775 [Acidobacteriaceae bacterium]|nr:hypothetical protein [Acidobacteriaceae bacterium]